MRPFVCFIALLLLASTAYAKPPRVNGVVWIGDLELRFDANRWDVNGAKTAYDLYCKTADCARTTIAVTVAPTAEACAPMALTFEDPDVREGPHIDMFSNAGLSFLRAVGDFGCRNRAGGPVRACTTYGGRSYMFDAPGQHCHTDIHAVDAVGEILMGLKPR